MYSRCFLLQNVVSVLWLSFWDFLIDSDKTGAFSACSTKLRAKTTCHMFTSTMETNPALCVKKQALTAQNSDICITNKYAVTLTQGLCLSVCVCSYFVFCVCFQLCVFLSHACFVSQRIFIYKIHFKKKKKKKKLLLGCDI